MILGGQHPGFDLTVVNAGAHIVIAVRGDVDAASAPNLRRILTEASRCHHLVALDLSGVTFLDAAGLGVLAHAVERSRDPAEIRLLNPSRSVRRLLALTGFDRVIPIEATGLKRDDPLSLPPGQSPERRRSRPARFFPFRGTVTSVSGDGVSSGHPIEMTGIGLQGGVRNQPQGNALCSPGTRWCAEPRASPATTFRKAPSRLPVLARPEVRRD